MLTCQPSAPAVGHELRLQLHAEARRRVVAPPAGQARQVEVVAVPLVDEAAADRAGAAVEVLVGAPDGEIDAPVVQLQRHVAGRVRQVEADDAALPRGPPRSGRGTSNTLAGQEVDAVASSTTAISPPRRRAASTSSARSSARRARADGQQASAGSRPRWRSCDCDGVQVGRERRLVDQDAVALGASGR